MKLSKSIIVSALALSVIACSNRGDKYAFQYVTFKNDIPYTQHKDVKVFDMDYVPIDPDDLSTNDNTFKQGKVGEYIRAQFPKPSRFERGESHG